MILYALDTNTLSAAMNGHDGVVSRMSEIPHANVFAAQPAWAEIAYGIARLPRSRRREWLEERRDIVQQSVQQMPWSDDVTIVFGDLKSKLEKQGVRLEDFDLAIAAHAVAAGAVLVTSNTKHMKRVPGLTVEDWSR